MRQFIILVFALAISQIVSAQYIIKGTVANKTTNEKLVGASVYITELNKGTVTSTNGEYTINGLRKGTYTIQISYLGFQTQIQKINSTESDITLNIQLQNTAIEVNEVVISGAYTTSQDESPQEIDVVKKSDMQQSGASTIMDVITKVPGVSAITTGPLVSRPVIRGLSGNRILTVVDGVRFETQQWDDEHGIGVNELGMDRVEIIKGPASLLYGPEAMGGVVHFIEEQPAAVGHITGDVYGGIRSNNMGFNGGADVKGATEKSNWSFGALGRVLPDYYYNAYDFRVPNTRMIEYGVRGSYGINRKWGSTSLSYQFNQAYYGILDGKDIVKKADGSIVNKDTAEVDMFPSEVEAPYHTVMDNKISSKTTLLLGNSRLNVVIGYQNNHRAEYEDDTLHPKVGYKYVDMMLQSGTYDVKWYMPTWKNFSTIIGAQGMYQTNTNANDSKTQLVPDATIFDYGFVALTKYNLKKFNLTAGLRYDARHLDTKYYAKQTILNLYETYMPAITKSYNNFSGAIGATYDIEEHLLLRANFATGYRSPNLNELMSDGLKLESQHIEIGNPNFVKEQNNEIDVSAIFKSKHFSIEVAAYQNNITNFIYLAPTPYIDVAYPVYVFKQADARINGGEAGIDIHPASLSWVHYEFKASTLKAVRTDNESYLPMMPTDKINNTLVFNLKEYKKFKNVFFKIGTITAFQQDKVATNEPLTSGYTLLNAALGVTRNVWKFNNIDFTLVVNNALDKVYMDNMSRLRTYGIANPGRNIVLSLRIPFDFEKKASK